MRVIEVSMEQHRNKSAGGNRRSPRKPANQRHRPARFPHAIIRQEMGCQHTSDKRAKCRNAVRQSEVGKLIASRQAQPIGNLPQHAIVNRTKGSFPETRTSKDRDLQNSPQWCMVKCCKVSWCFLSAVHTRRTQQEVATKVGLGETERIAATHERAARHPLHMCCDGLGALLMSGHFSPRKVSIGQRWCGKCLQIRLPARQLPEFGALQVVLSRSFAWVGGAKSLDLIRLQRKETMQGEMLRGSKGLGCHGLALAMTTSLIARNRKISSTCQGALTPLVIARREWAAAGLDAEWSEGTRRVGRCVTLVWVAGVWAEPGKGACPAHVKVTSRYTTLATLQRTPPTTTPDLFAVPAPICLQGTRAS
ncbi:hypothetical protein PR048_025157 [Dryococelus australis]|uniref:Uncharacterized protein n=1 Tax=Dryococelus australis TaxID=614101 RepID=A0ABQ9GQP0_9NEOP|nr:hypothetical protein PR048_025157 [Dryococelus australis]